MGPTSHGESVLKGDRVSAGAPPPLQERLGSLPGSIFKHFGIHFGKGSEWQRLLDASQMTSPLPLACWWGAPIRSRALLPSGPEAPTGAEAPKGSWAWPAAPGPHA